MNLQLHQICELLVQQPVSNTVAEQLVDILVELSHSLLHWEP